MLAHLQPLEPGDGEVRLMFLQARINSWFEKGIEQRHEMRKDLAQRSNELLLGYFRNGIKVYVKLHPTGLQAEFDANFANPPE